MKQSIEKVTRVLAVTAALAIGTTEGAVAEMQQPISPKQARVIKLARKFTQELYDTKNFPKGVPVPGILNGSVRIHNPIGNTTSFDNPVVLAESHSPTKADKNGRLLDGSWIGIPANDANGHVVLEPVQIHLGNQYGESESLHLKNKHDTVLEGAGIYPTSVSNAPDELIGFDIQGNSNFPAVHIKADGMK
jgi:hypothetical protein